MTVSEARWRLQLISELTVGAPIREQERASADHYSLSKRALGVP